MFARVPTIPSHGVFGQDALIDEIIDRLTSDGVSALAIYGQPSIGKTTAAVALVNSEVVRERFSDGILWASLGRSGDAMLPLSAWGDALGVDVNSLDNEESRSLAIRDAIADRKMLLVIDDAWDIRASNFLNCGGPNCCHLLTTRDQGIARSFAGTRNAYPLEPLGTSDVFDLMQVLAPELSSANPGIVWSLSEDMTGLPGAVKMLGGFLSSPELSHPFNMDPDLVGPTHRAELAQNVIGSEPEPMLSRLVDLCVNSLPDGVLDGFNSLGTFASDPEDFGRDAAAAVSGLQDASLDLLVARYLLYRRGGRLTLDSVAADHIRGNVPNDARTRHWGHYLSVVNADRRNWPVIEAEYGQVRQAWSQAENAGGLTAMANAVQPFQQHRGLQREYLAWTKRILGTADDSEAMGAGSGILIYLGLEFPRSGGYQDDLEFYTRAVSVMEDIGDREGMAPALNNLGCVYYWLGQLLTARVCLDRAALVMEEIGNHRGFATVLNNSGAVRDGLGQLNDALDFYNRALPMMNELEDHSGIGSILNNMGRTYDSIGHRELALEFYDRALSIMDESGDQYGEAVTRFNMANAIIAGGNLNDAETHLLRVLEVWEAAQSPELERALETLADVRRRLIDGSR